MTDLDALDRRYLALQRRCILYGVLAAALATYVIVWAVKHFSLSVVPAIALGSVLGFVFTQTAVFIVRRFNPL